MDEYNKIVIRNDEPPVNAYTKTTVKNDIAIIEAKSVSEVSEKVIEESGSLYTAGLSSTTTKAAEAQKISAAVSQVTVTASAVTVVAAVVAVAVMTTASVTAPLAQVIGADLKYYNHGGDVCIEFVLEDEDNELESLYAWIENDVGEQITCEITVGDGVYLANAVLADESAGEMSFVVYAASNGGWEGELYRGAIVIPSAPDIGVEYTTSYNAESGELIITYELYDDNSALGEYTVQVLDSSGNTVESTVDYTQNTVTLTINDAAAELYLTINAATNGGWNGEIFNEVITIPETPDIGVEYTTAYNADSGELVISYELYDESAALGEYTVQVLDSSGDIVESTVDYTQNTITLTINDTAAELYLTINAATNGGWTGEIFNELIAIPEATDVGVEYTTAYNADSGELIITYELYDDNSALGDYTVQILNSSGDAVESTVDYTQNTITLTINDTTSELYLTINATSTDGWTGEIFNELIAIPETPDIGVEYTTAYNAESGEMVITYELYDDNSALGEYTVQVLDSSGNTVESTIDYTQNTVTLTINDTTSELYLTINATSTGGWSGEIFNELIAIPEAPEVGVEYTTAYNAESGELIITYELYDDNLALGDYTVQILNSSGDTIESTVDYTQNTITLTINDTAAELYLTINATTNGGWSGEIFNEVITIPETPDIGVEYTTAYNAESGELIVIFEIYDDNSQLSEYTVQLTDGTNELTSTVDYTANTITTTITDTTAELYIVISGTSVDNWTGTIFNEAIAIPTAPDVTISEILDDGWYEEGGEMYMNVYFTGDTANVTFSYWFEDDYGNIIACEIVEETEEYICAYAAFDGSIDFTLDERGRLSFVISATTADGWTGEIYREKYIIEPVAPDVEVTDVTVTSYSYDTTLTVQFTAEDINGEIAYYEAWYSDYVGYSDCILTQDGYTFTATADVSGLDTSGNLAFYVYCVTYDGWSNYLYGDNLTLPTASDLTAEVEVDSAMYSDAVVYVYVYYTGDTSVISAYEYWFEDEEGNKFVYDLGDVYDGVVYGTTTLSPSDNPALDNYGRMDFVIAVTTTDGWHGEIYREKFTIVSDGYLTYPELTGVTINYYETDFYTEMQISVYDPDYILTALYITLTDANTSLDLTGGELSVEIGVETDAEDVTTYYISLYNTTITPLEDYTVKVYLLADLTVDEITTESVLVDAYYTVTVG